MPTVKFAVPKGSIEAATFKILEEAWHSIVGSGRTYRIRLSDPEIEVKVLRPGDSNLCAGRFLRYWNYR